MKKFLIALLSTFAALASAQTHTVLLTWTASSSQTIAMPTLVNVYRGVTATASCAGMMWTQIATGQPAAGPYTDETVVDGTNYCYEVRAYFISDGPGAESGGSNWAYVPVPLPAAPKAAAPAGLVGRSQSQ